MRHAQGCSQAPARGSCAARHPNAVVPKGRVRAPEELQPGGQMYRA